MARIAADIGLEGGGLLEAEVQALNKRLEGIRGTLDTMTEDVNLKSQKREKVEDELQQTKVILQSIRQVSLAIIY